MEGRVARCLLHQALQQTHRLGWQFMMIVASHSQCFHLFRRTYDAERGEGGQGAVSRLPVQCWYAWSFHQSSVHRLVSATSGEQELRDS